MSLIEGADHVSWVMILTGMHKNQVWGGRGDPVGNVRAQPMELQFLKACSKAETMDPSDTHEYWDWEEDTLVQDAAKSSLLLKTTCKRTMVRAGLVWVIRCHCYWDAVPNWSTRELTVGWTWLGSTTA